MTDIVRVLRVYEFVGPRDKVELQVARSIHGEKDWGNGVTIRAATIGTYPEILEAAKPESAAPEGWKDCPGCGNVPEVKTSCGICLGEGKVPP